MSLQKMALWPGSGPHCSRFPPGTPSGSPGRRSRRAAPRASPSTCRPCVRPPWPRTRSSCIHSLRLIAGAPLPGPDLNDPNRLGVGAGLEAVLVDVADRIADARTGTGSGRPPARSDPATQPPPHPRRIIPVPVVIQPRERRRTPSRCTGTPSAATSRRSSPAMNAVPPYGKYSSYEMTFPARVELDRRRPLVRIELVVHVRRLS